jgi:hypothetical protein
MEETMKVTKRFWRYLVMAMSFVGMLSISSAAELNPAAVIYKLPDQIPWSPVAHAARKTQWLLAIRPSPPSMPFTPNGPRAITSAGHNSIPTTVTSPYYRVLGG